MLSGMRPLRTRQPLFGEEDNFEHKLEVIDLPATFGCPATIFTESLILAQDERWRRA